MRLKRNDLVVVISGTLRGKQGRVLRILRDDDKVIVQGLNLRFKHLRRSQKNPQGGRVQKEAPLPLSKVQLVDPKTNQPTRVGYRWEGDTKIRYAKKSGEPV
ncbi:MAG TPA: 50S ribosomal protein L24 [Planctomycetota bacterium]|jgi:large subunit ribosomal protein L24|nr:50S ribosomal protein L24 [Planctomycetota bacterium]